MTPHPISWRSILILPSILRLGFLSGIFISRSRTKTLYAPLHSLHFYVLCAPPISLFFSDDPHNIWWAVRSCSSSLCGLLLSPVTLFLLGPNIFLFTLFLNTFSLYSSLRVRDQVSHPYKTTGKIIVETHVPLPLLTSYQRLSPSPTPS